MSVDHSKPHRTWTIAEAKARLSEILRLAEEEGPQHIGARKSFVVIPAQTWHAQVQPRKPVGQWLLDNIPRGVNLQAPDRKELDRESPFVDR